MKAKKTESQAALDEHLNVLGDAYLFYKLNPDLARQALESVTPEDEVEFAEEYAACRAALKDLEGTG